ncbi:MAG TPA: pirin family protein [Mycobacteriales bacterium]|nr:pirin family protein [Mycobacteriales bacterium]
MSGPVDADRPVVAAAERDGGPALEVLPSRETDVVGIPVRRALPQRRRRTVGAWCFVDHLGPARLDERTAVEIGPHPHTGLHTVTWLVEGTQVHRDSLGSEQLIRPGQLNLMTAGGGVAHAEESLDYRGPIAGVQLWVAQPEATRHGDAGFEHHADLPQLELPAAVATVLVGRLADAESKARADTPLLGVDLALRSGTTTLPLQREHEHAVVVLDGAVRLDGDRVVRPGALAYLGVDRDELALAAEQPTRALLLGGEPFGEQVLMWWNFVARTHEEIDRAYADWVQGSGRFGPVASELARIPAPRPPWQRTA